MKKFIIVTFVALGWAFYVASGGSDFEPVQRAEVEPEVPEVEETAPEPVVADLSTPSDGSVETGIDASIVLTNLTDPVVDADPAEADVETTLAGVDDTPVVAEEAPVEVAVAAQPEAAIEITADPDPIDMREVAGSRVNMRSGPGTDYGVLATLSRGELAEILEIDASGWARIRVIGSDQVGWMAIRLLQPF